MRMNRVVALYCAVSLAGIGFSSDAAAAKKGVLAKAPCAPQGATVTPGG